MDAPPEHEDVRPFLNTQAMFEALGVHVPHIKAQNLELGALVLEDFGDTAYWPCFHKGQTALYSQALKALADWQMKAVRSDCDVPDYDAEKLQQEMDLLTEWYLPKELGVSATDEQLARLKVIEQALLERALAQPQTLVHRDFHSRNLMVIEGDKPGVIDFQDAVWGAWTYDAVSLLKDCYIEWPREQVLTWLRAYYDELTCQGFERDWDAFVIDFDWIGLQRHIKVLGIFARLHWRDGKSGYLKDIPLTLRYVRTTSALYPELADLNELLNEWGAPR